MGLFSITPPSPWLMAAAISLLTVSLILRYTLALGFGGRLNIVLIIPLGYLGVIYLLSAVNFDGFSDPAVLNLASRLALLIIFVAWTLTNFITSYDEWHMRRKLEKLGIPLDDPR